jgi:penicillin-binding protein 1A
MAGIFHRLKLKFTEKISNINFRSIILKASAYLSLIILTIGLLFFLVIYLIYDVSALNDFLKPEPTKLYDSQEKVYAIMDYSAKRKVIPLARISPFLVKAVISTEDNEFYKHHGISGWGILRALLGKGGGSTITQQLGKNIFLTAERSLIRKLKELVIAIKIENTFSKDKILELYLNEIYWGDHGFYGIESASNYFFGKSAQYLDLYESTLIAGILPAPQLWSPKVNFKKAKWRQSLVLDNMVKNGYITKAQAEVTKKTIRKLINYKFQGNYKYPYFTDYVVERLEKINKKYFSDKFLSRGGLKIYTTINQQYQKNAEIILRQEINKLSRYNVRQGIIISINPKNGYIRAFVGGKDYQGINRIFSLRQPGSTFKPFVYLTYYNTWFSTGHDTFDDSLQSATYKNALQVECKKNNYTFKEENLCYRDYVVRNYNNTYLGKVSLDTAIQKSLNTIPVHLASELGINNIIETAKELGIQSKLRPELGTSLGASEVTPFELISAYTVLAGGGYKPERITAISRILDKDNNPIYDAGNGKSVQVYSTRAVYKLNKSLIKVVEGGTGNRAYIPGKLIAGKTGTTSNYHDAWFIGYTPSLVTLVWLGNDDNSKMIGITGSACAAIFRKYISSISYNIPDENFAEQDDIFTDTYFEARKDLDTRIRKYTGFNIFH